MSIQLLSRGGIAVFFVALVSGCSTTEPAPADFAATTVECKQNRRSCLYEGSYEPDERAYAEEEARRLNQAQARKFRRAIGR